LAKLMFDAPKSYVAVGEIKASLFDEFV